MPCRAREQQQQQQLLIVSPLAPATIIQPSFGGNLFSAMQAAVGPAQPPAIGLAFPSGLHGATAQQAKLVDTPMPKGGEHAVQHVRFADTPIPKPGGSQFVRFADTPLPKAQQQLQPQQQHVRLAGMPMPLWRPSEVAALPLALVNSASGGFKRVRDMSPRDAGGTTPLVGSGIKNLAGVLAYIQPDLHTYIRARCPATNAFD